MTDNTLAETIASSPAEEIAEVSTTETEAAPSQEKDPVEAELERVERKPKRTKLEQLEYTKRRVEEQLAEEKRKAGIADEDEDTRPITVADLKRIREEEAVETAIGLAESLENEHERRLTKHYLENNLRSTGDPQQDFDLAYAMVTAVKNRQKAEEAGRAQKVRTAASAPSSPAREKSNEDLTPEELQTMKAFKLTKEEVINARQ